MIWVLIMVLYAPADPVMLAEAHTYTVPLEYLKSLEACTKESERLAVEWMLSYPGTRDAFFTCARKDRP